MVLREVVPFVVLSGLPEDKELFLGDVIPDPVISHVHGA
jgi:hypothetical protein